MTSFYNIHHCSLSSAFLVLKLTISLVYHLKILHPFGSVQTTNRHPSRRTGKTKKKFLQTTTPGVELGFTITLHKIQGQTCEKLIVDINDRPFIPHINFQGLHVAMSRVRRSAALRILLTASPAKQNKLQLSHGFTSAPTTTSMATSF